MTARLRAVRGEGDRRAVIAEASRRLKGFNPFRPPGLEPDLAARARCAIDQRVRQGMPRERATYQAGLWFLGEAERLSGSVQTAKRADEALRIAHHLLATVHGEAALRARKRALLRRWLPRVAAVVVAAAASALAWWLR